MWAERPSGTTWRVTTDEPGITALVLIYVIAEVPLGGWLISQLEKHLPPDTFAEVGKRIAGWVGHDGSAEAISGVAKGAVLLVLYWLFLWWLYAKRVFVRI